MSENLTFVPAGAGSGKTWRIEKTLAAWVEEGAVAPGRILAVTFTEAAATELRGRIRGELMRRGRIDDALEIDRAYVGTIHGLGQRLLTEHAFAAGRSPAPRLLTEAERDLAIRREVARCDALRPLMEDLGRFGYAWDAQTGKSAEEAFRSDILRTLDVLRGLGTRGGSPEIADGALNALDEGYGPRADDGDALTQALAGAVEKLLDDFPDALTPHGQSAAARKDFAKNHETLRRAARGRALSRNWKLWQSLRKLRLSNSRQQTPDGYDERAEAVIAAADSLLRHPGPLADAKAHLKALVTGAQQILTAYDDAKRKAGLIDYADMIAETEVLLRTEPRILEAVLGEIDCVVIDEFQDTNPVQFALLWRLARSAGRALIVGDTKQSIMGFQGADPRLSEALIATHPKSVEPQGRNFRSDPRIMALVNAIGPRLFPEGYDPLAPARPETGETALEVIELPPAGGGRKDQTAAMVADRVATLIEDGARVQDPSSKHMRPVGAPDIAVLCYTSAKCQQVADALRARGLPVRIQGDGWLEAPATRAARAALAFIADPDDLYAAIGWLTLGPAAVPLEDAMRNAADRVLVQHAALVPLLGLAGTAESRPVADLLADLLRDTNLPGWAAGLADAAQAHADLARLEAEALAFDRMALDLRTAAGFHGSGVQIFLGWIAEQTEKDWNRHPDASGWSSAGVEVSTWHAAKGREWPVTVVAGLDFRFMARPGLLTAEFADFSDLDNVLDHAGLGWLPDFAAPETQKAFADQRIASDERSAARAIYVALTRARDRLVLALPQAPSKPQERPARMIDLLRARSGLTVESGRIVVADQAFPAHKVAAAGANETTDVAPPNDPRLLFGAPRAAAEGPRTPWRRSPSSLEADTGAAQPMLRHVDLGAPVAPDTDDFASATERGTAWHLAFRTLCARPDLADRLAAATGIGPQGIQAIAAQATAVHEWLTAEGYDRLHFEMPLELVGPDGATTNAIVDCLAEGPSGCLILDHKSGPCPDPAVRFAGYLPQLVAYANLVARIRKTPVDRVAINWMNEGTLSVAETPADALA